MGYYPRSLIKVFFIVMSLFVSRHNYAENIDTLIRPEIAGEQDYLDTPNRLCGISCVYAYAHASEIQIEFEDLIVPTYISTIKGSSLSDLAQAVNSSSLQAEPVKGTSKNTFPFSASVI